MILKFGASNFGCFKEQVDISFENKDEVSQVLCIEGANGSGKTTLLKILGFLTDFIPSSFTKNEADKKIILKTHFGSTETTFIYIDFKPHDDEYRYRYEVSIKCGKITQEKLTRKKKSSKTYSIFERIDNEITKTLNEFKLLKQMTLRSNASTVSTAIQYSFGLEKFGTYFGRMQANVNLDGYCDGHYYNLPVTTFSQSLYENKDMLKEVKKFLMQCDLGISDLVIKASKNSETVEHYPVFSHGKHTLTYSEESSGTQTLYKALIPYYFSTAFNGTLIYDEFDKHLHSLILPKLLELFKNTQAQFIFTTFDIDIMDELGKYKIYIVEKEDNESYAYRLDELKGIRTDRPVSGYYKKGLLGGIPK